MPTMYILFPIPLHSRQYNYYSRIRLRTLHPRHIAPSTKEKNQDKPSSCNRCGFPFISAPSHRNYRRHTRTYVSTKDTPVEIKFFKKSILMCTSR